MLVLKYISCVLAIIATVSFIMEIITIMKSGPELFLPWKEGTETTGVDVHRKVSNVLMVIMAIFWSIVIVF